MKYILISIDTLRADVAEEVGLPRLFDQWCSEYYTSCNWTLPSHAALLTGDALAHGCHYDWAFPEDQKQSSNITETKCEALSGRTIAEEFQSLDYQTLAYVGGGFVSHWFGFSRGFDSWDEGCPSPLMNGLDRLVVPDGSFVFIHDWWVHDYFMDAGWDIMNMREDEFLVPSERLTPIQLAAGLESYKQRARQITERLAKFLAINRDATILLVSDHGECFMERENQVHHGVYSDLRHPEVSRVPLAAINLPAKLPEVAFDIGVKPLLVPSHPKSPDYVVGRYSYWGDQYMYTRTAEEFDAEIVPSIDESSTSEVTVPEELMQRLKQLGYAQ